MKQEIRDVLLSHLKARTFDLSACVDALYKSVGDRPRMMIEGMSVYKISEEMILEPAEHDKETIYTRLARVAYRLANTPVPVVDPLEPEARRIFNVYVSACFDGRSQRKWDELSDETRNGWRAVAKMMEERK